MLNSSSYFSLNGQFITDNLPLNLLNDRGLAYGHGLFESILLNDSSLTDRVNVQIIKDIYMKKQGFRIKISPLSRKISLRVCEKIKASGELCEISNN